MAPTVERPLVVAVINSSPDVIDMLRIAFEHAGFLVVSTFTFAIRNGEVDLEAFLRLHRPAAIIYDLAPPYKNNWQLFLHLREVPGFQDRPIILTSTNPRRLQEFADVGQAVFEVMETPYEINNLIDTVARATGRRLSSSDGPNADRAPAGS